MGLGRPVGDASYLLFKHSRSTTSRLLSETLRKSLFARFTMNCRLLSKEHLGILNGTAFSAAVAALALNDATHLAMLAQVCTAMGTEVLLGERMNNAPFIHAVARPHPGQVC
jgi:phenylalanine ammonia-lyase